LLKQTGESLANMMYHSLGHDPFIFDPELSEKGLANDSAVQMVIIDVLVT